MSIENKAKEEAGKIDDGGPAFPAEATGHPSKGMSLRDWFAGQVSAYEIEQCTPDSIGGCSAMLGISITEYDGSRHFPQVCAIVRYQIANAMLSARKSGVSQ